MVNPVGQANQFQRLARAIHAPPTTSAMCVVTTCGNQLVGSRSPKASHAVAAVTGRTAINGSPTPSATRSGFHAVVRSRAAAAMHVAVQSRPAATANRKNSR